MIDAITPVDRAIVALALAYGLWRLHERLPSSRWPLVAALATVAGLGLSAPLTSLLTPLTALEAVVLLVAGLCRRQYAPRWSSVFWVSFLTATAMGAVAVVLSGALAAAGVNPPPIGISRGQAQSLVTARLPAGAPVLATTAVRRSELGIAPDGWAWAVFYARQTDPPQVGVVWLDFLTGTYGGRDEGLAAAQVMANVNLPAHGGLSESASFEPARTSLLGLLGGIAVGYAGAAITMLVVTPRVDPSS